MNMFIPPKSQKQEPINTPVQSNQIALKSSHIYIAHDLAKKIFDDDLNVYCAYYPKMNKLILSPTSNEFFKNIHKPRKLMLKNRNQIGDKTIALHDILIDNQVDKTDRLLSFNIDEKLSVINILL